MLNTATEGNVLTDLLDDRHFRTGQDQLTFDPSAHDWTTLWTSVDTAITDGDVSSVPTPDDFALRTRMRLGFDYVQEVEKHRMGVAFTPLPTTIQGFTTWPP